MNALARSADALRTARHAIVLAWRRPAIAGLALLAALACFAATAAARADFATRTRALHSTIDTAGPTTRMIDAEGDWIAIGQIIGREPAAMTAAGNRIGARLAAASLPLSAADDSWTSIELPLQPIVAPAGATRPRAYPADMRMVYRDTYQTEGKLVAGRWPTSAQQPPDQPLEADLAPATAKLLGVNVGSVLSIATPSGRGQIRLLIVGLVVPRDASSAFWASDHELTNPQLLGLTYSDTQHWGTAAMLGATQIAALTGGQDVSGPNGIGRGLGGPTQPDTPVALWWGFPLDVSGLDADSAAPMADRLDTMSGVESALQYDPALPLQVTLNSGLTQILRDFVSAQRTTLIEEAMPLYGLALIVVIAGVLLAYGAVDRRRAEAGVMRARGAATWYLTLQVLAESCLTALPVSAAAIVLGSLVPGHTPPGLYPVVIVAGLCATLAPALFTALVHRPRRAARVQTLARRAARIARHRRIIVQTALAAACLAGIELVRSQGLTSSGGSVTDASGTGTAAANVINPYAAAVPVLAASLAALVTINLLPFALRAARRRALSLRGVVALLGVARAAYEPGTGQAATFVLTTAACTADLSVALASQARHTAPGPLGSAATTTLNVLAVLAVVAACAVAALAVRLGAAARRAADERLVTMGLTTGQARAIALAENAPPALGGALTGALATVPLLRIVGPALGGSAIPASAAALVLPALAVAIPAAAAGVAGAWTLNRNRTRTGGAW